MKVSVGNYCEQRCPCRKMNESISGIINYIIRSKATILLWQKENVAWGGNNLGTIINLPYKSITHHSPLISLQFKSEMSHLSESQNYRIQCAPTIKAELISNKSPFENSSHFKGFKGKLRTYVFYILLLMILTGSTNAVTAEY